MVQSDMLLGMLAAAGAAACFDGAVILQASDARTVPLTYTLKPSLLKRLVRRPRWLIGTGLAVLGWPLQLLAFSLAPLTVVQPTLALGVLLLLFGGARVLGERVGPREWAAATAIIVGVVLFGLFGPDHTDSVPSAAATLLALGPLAFVAVLPFLLGPRRSSAWVLIAAAGSAFAITGLTGKLLTAELAAHRPLMALVYAALTGAAAAVGFLVDMSALQRYDATRVAPPMFVLETAIPVLLAPVLFDERWGQTPGGGALIALGLVLVLGGGAMLGRSRAVTAIEELSATGELEDQPGGGGTVGVGEVDSAR